MIVDTFIGKNMHELGYSLGWASVIPPNEQDTFPMFPKHGPAGFRALFGGAISSPRSAASTSIGLGSYA